VKPAARLWFVATAAAFARGIVCGGAFCLLVGGVPRAHAQNWTADVYAGSTRYGALLDHVSTTNLIGSLRHQRASGQTWLSLAAPLDADAAVWSAAGAQHRLGPTTRHRSGIGIEIGASAYGFHGAAGAGSGGGATVSLLPHLMLRSDVAMFELRAGRQQHYFEHPDTNGTRGLYEVGTRVGVVRNTNGAWLDARWLRASEAAYPHVGIHVSTAAGPVRLWANAGRWYADALDDMTWGAGASIEIGGTADVWLSVRHDATDPLYLATARSSWNLGVSRRIGRPAPAPPRAMAPVIAAGRVRILLPASAARDGSPSVAGEFSDWAPLAMQREGGHWVLELPLRSGVHRFSFVSGSGEWFVPELYPGRMDDGMGGHVAVLVIP
jgi:hypothetical protein